MQCTKADQRKRLLPLTWNTHLPVVLGSYNIPPLDSTDGHYAAPKTNSSDLVCECDTVTYRCATLCNWLQERDEFADSLNHATARVQSLHVMR